MNPSNIFNESDSDNDTSSVGTNWTEQSVQQNEYGVDHILADQGEDGDKKYLVKWTGYPEHRSTWEPPENLGATTIELWLEKSKAIRQGFETQFDVQAWEAEQHRINNVNQHRWNKRTRKLITRGRLIDPPESHPAAKHLTSSCKDSDLFVSPSAPIVPINTSAGRKGAVSRSRALAAAIVKNVQGKYD